MNKAVFGGRLAHHKPKTAIALNIIWWIIWLACVLFLHFLWPTRDGGRATLPYGQYYFFLASVFSSIFVGFTLHDKLSQFISLRHIRVFAWLVCLLFAAAFVSAIFGISPVYGLRLEAILFISSLPFLLYGINYGGAFQRWPWWCEIGPLLCVSLLSVLGVLALQWNSGLAVGPWMFENHLHGGTRWSFLYDEANGLGMMSVLAITCLYYSIARAESIWTKIIALIFVGFSLYVFWKTNSRASLLWLVYASLLYAVVGMLKLYQCRAQNRWMSKVIILGLIGLLYWLAINFSLRFEQFLRLEQPDITSGRMHIWIKFLHQFLENFLLGFGFGATGDLLQGQKPGSPLNVFIGVAGETGLSGLVPLLLLWFGAIYWASKVAFSRKADSRQAKYAVWLLALLGGMALQQMGEWNILRVAFINYLFFYAVAAAWALGAYSQRPAETS